MVTAGAYSFSTTSLMHSQRQLHRKKEKSRETEVECIWDFSSPNSSCRRDILLHSVSIHFLQVSVVLFFCEQTRQKHDLSTCSAMAPASLQEAVFIQD